MRILFSSDWHLEEKFVVDPKRQSRDVHLLAAQAREIQPDVLIVAGDITWGEDGVYEKYLSLFDDLNCIKLAIAGNHDAAFEVGPRHEEELAMVLADLGFHYLDAAPCCIDGVGFVGTMGWYDGTLSNPTETKAIPISDPFAGGPRVIGSIQPRDAVWTAKMLARLDAPRFIFLIRTTWTKPLRGSCRFALRYL